MNRNNMQKAERTPKASVSGSNPAAGAQNFAFDNVNEDITSAVDAEQVTVDVSALYAKPNKRK